MDDQDQIQAVYTNDAKVRKPDQPIPEGPTIWVPSYHHFDALGSTRSLTDESGEQRIHMYTTHWEMC